MIAALVTAPLFLSSCATKTGSAVAGGAAYKVYDDKKDQEKKEDLAWVGQMGVVGNTRQEGLSDLVQTFFFLRTARWDGISIGGWVRLL